jgi:hypothetical protein
MKRLLSYDPFTGVSSYYESDGGRFKIAHEQDVSKHLEYSKALQNMPEYKRGGIKSDYYHFAHVPAVVLVEWKDKYGVDYNNKDDLPKIEKLLSSNEYKHLRTVDRI